MDKKELRSKYLILRKGIKNRSEKEKKINNFLKSLNLSSKEKVSGYFPVRGEVNILPFMHFLSEKKNLICMPFITKNNYHLLFKSWKDGQKMFKDRFNILTPLNGKFTRPTVMLVPLIAFDKKKNRLGYGGGFYDRTIKYLEKFNSLQTIGIAFNEQEIDIIPTMRFDKKLNKIVTPKGIIK
ncbi:MAG: 5-formyltetrahydrofolate cyclo-ligase [Alphaproteobacteria bacterium]|nr:5-formyltetrahydrofolate cyclo-ligase [Alphaproteobacteria bacterium]